MQKIEVKKTEYKVVSSQDDLVLYTRELGADIAISIMSVKLKKVGLIRVSDHDQLVEFFQEVNTDNLEEKGLIKINIIGGDDSESAKQAFKSLISQLQIIDNNKDIIDIKTSDTCDKFHPESFEVDCYHGGVRAIL